MVGKVRQFVVEVVSELKKVSWSTRNELLVSTWIVIISSTFLGVFIGVLDFALSKLLGLLIR